MLPGCPILSYSSVGTQIMWLYHTTTTKVLAHNVSWMSHTKLH